MPLLPELAAFAYLLDAHLCRTTGAGSAPWCGTPLSTIVQAGKMPLAETLLNEPVLPALARPGSRQPWSRLGPTCACAPGAGRTGRAWVMQAQVGDGPGKGKSPLTAPAPQQLYLIFATVISTYDLVIYASGAGLPIRHAVDPQFKRRVQKTLDLAFNRDRNTYPFPTMPSLPFGASARWNWLATTSASCPWRCSATASAWTGLWRRLTMIPQLVTLPYTC
jgi:hypothetical protein